jgi:hypothetical protein
MPRMTVPERIVFGVFLVFALGFVGWGFYQTARVLIYG